MHGVQLGSALASNLTIARSCRTQVSLHVKQHDLGYHQPAPCNMHVPALVVQSILQDVRLDLI